MLKDRAFKVGGNEKTIDTVEWILKFNNENQLAEDLKILIPRQMVRRLAISLAQLNAGNNSEKLKNEVMQPLYSLHRSKSFGIKVWSTLFNHGE